MTKIFTKDCIIKIDDELMIVVDKEMEVEDGLFYDSLSKHIGHGDILILIKQ